MNPHISHSGSPASQSPRPILKNSRSVWRKTGPSSSIRFSTLGFVDPQADARDFFCDYAYHIGNRQVTVEDIESPTP